jgi:hypothetical protein
VPDFAEFRLADDTVVRLELAPVGQPPDFDGELHDLPEGFSTPVPVGRGSRAAGFAADSLRRALRPLGLVLQEVHDSLGTVGNPPQEVSVELGIQIGQDLKMGIVGANGQASMRISATWRPAPVPVAPAPVAPGSVAAVAGPGSAVGPGE